MHWQEPLGEFVVRKLILILSEVEVMKLIPTQIQSINLLLSVGEAALSAINSDSPVSPVSYAVSPHMDISARIKILTRRIVIYKSELPTNNRTNGPMAKYLQIGNSLDKTFSLLKVAF
jgi:hypothetical protein